MTLSAENQKLFDKWVNSKQAKSKRQPKRSK